MKKVLIAYFSHEGEAYVGGEIVKLKIGNTRVAAQMVHGLIGGDVFRIETEKPYPDDHMETVELPNWWGTCPMAVFTFLEGHDFFGKTILPLCTHEGSGMGRSEADIQAACPGAKVEKGLAVTGGRVAQAENDIRKWLERYGF